MDFDWKFEDTFEFDEDICDLHEKVIDHYLDQFLDEIAVEERDIVLATDNEIYPLYYEWAGFMETNVLEMKHEFSPKLLLKDIDTSEASSIYTAIPSQIEFPEWKVSSCIFPNFFWTPNDEHNGNFFEVKEEFIKSRNDIRGKGSNGCCGASSKVVNKSTIDLAGCVHPSGLMKRREFLPQTIKCPSNTTPWLKQTCSTLTTRIRKFCRLSLPLSVSPITHYQLGLKTFFPSACLFFLIFPLLASASTTETNVTVQHLTVMVGQQVTLHCSVNHPDSVIWRHESVGKRELNMVHYDGFGLIGFYRSGGRHSIEDGTTVLTIKNVTDSDAGIYTCHDEILEEHFDVYDIVILKSLPSCSSNVDLADVIGENDCGIDPDLLRLHCSVVYFGNTAPVLRWQNSGGEHAMIGTNVSTPVRDETNYSTESTLTVTAKMGLHDTYFTCQVADLQSDGIVPECRTDELIVHSLHNSSDAPEKNLKSEKEISCTANSNQPCNYQWTHQSQKYKIAIHGSILNSQDVSFGDGIYECQAECRLRGQICHTMPLRITVVADGGIFVTRTVGDCAPLNIVIGVLSGSLLAAIIFAIVLQWKKVVITRNYRTLHKQMFYATSDCRFRNEKDHPYKDRDISNLENRLSPKLSSDEYMDNISVPVNYSDDVSLEDDRCVDLRPPSYEIQPINSVQIHAISY